MADEIEINGESYLRLYKRQFVSQPEWIAENIYFWESDGKVYRYDEALGQEDMIYDFNIEG